MIRLYRNYDPSLFHGPVQMVSAFRGLNEVLQVKRGSGLVTDWKQSGGTLLVGGDSRIIRVWDAATESQVMVRFHTSNASEHSLNSSRVYRISTRTLRAPSLRWCLTAARRRS